MITGSGSEMGRALALELAARGAVLALSDIDPTAADRTAEDCRATGATARSWQSTLPTGTPSSSTRSTSSTPSEACTWS